ncbi:helix-turn-helix domain-containing protein [Providencia rettgeri]|uniref:helix-turn-helix domain-containing protein n=1 Tax=Providencia rettgeri TaxID=587 RepID=UPI002362C98E|nr:helix-turn-helix transcriptional regulator [Providencia rettgeri]
MRNKAVGDLIKNKRTTKNISASEIAKNLTISEDKYIQFENGEQSFYIDDITVISHILDISAYELLKAYGV